MPLPPDDSGLAPSDLTTLCAFPPYTSGNTFNVKSSPYNAVGDGVADDSAAIRSAISAAITGGGHAFIYFPTGTYNVCKATSTIDTELYQPIFDLTSGDRDPSNLCFIGDGPTLSIIKGFMPSLGDPDTAWEEQVHGGPSPQISRFIIFFTGTVVHWSNLQFRSLAIDGQVGYTGDFTVGGSWKWTGATPAAAGSGYQVNDILTVSNATQDPTNGQDPVVGFATETAQLKVETINGSGGVLTVSINQAGRYNSVRAAPLYYSVQGGHGTGATFTAASDLTGDGWDQLHKAFYLFEGSDVLIYNCDLRNFKGEVIFGGTNNAVSVVLTQIRSTNSSSISISSDLLVSDCVIGGTGTTSDLVYNGTENAAITAGQGTICRRTSTRAASNGFVYFGVAGTQFLIDDCDIYQRILLASQAHDVVMQNSRFHAATITSSFADDIGFHNFLLKDNTVTGRADANSMDFWAGQAGVSDGLVLQNNTLTLVNGPLYLMGGDIFQAGAVLIGNTLNGGAIDVDSGFGHTKVGLWISTAQPSGTGGCGYGLHSDGNGDTSTIFPITDFTKLTSNNGNTHYIEIDDTLMGRYPDNFQTTFRRGSGVFVLKKNSAWNAFGADVTTGNDTTIKLNGSRLFEVVPPPPPPPPPPMTENTIVFSDLDSDSVDDSLNGHDGSDTDMSYDGTIATFNGSSSKVSITSAADINATDAITIAAWMKTSVDGGYIVAKEDNWFLAMGVGAAHKAGFYLLGPDATIAWTNSTTSVDDNALHLIVGTYDKATGDAKIYVDGSGTPETTQNDAGKHAITGGASPLVYGNRFGGWYSGKARCIWILGRAMTGAEVTTMYNAGVPKKWADWTPPLAAGTLAQTAVGITTASLSYATVSGGTSPYSNQLKRSLVSGSGYSNVGSPQVGATAFFSDSGLTAATDYYYIVVTTDNASQTATSNEVHVTTSAAAAGRQCVHMGIGISL